jgi:hypothetical protein
MINGAHAILYSDDAEATRAALAKVLGTRSVDAGGGWLIFALPPAEGIEVTRPISDQGWGLLTAITLPGGVGLGLYQPRHPTAAQPT